MLLLSAAWANQCVGLPNAVLVVAERLSRNPTPAEQGFFWSFWGAAPLLPSPIAGAGMSWTRFAPFASMDLLTDVLWISWEAVAATSIIHEVSNLRDGESLEGVLHIPWP